MFDNKVILKNFIVLEVTAQDHLLVRSGERVDCMACLAVEPFRRLLHCMWVAESIEKPCS